VTGAFFLEREQDGFLAARPLIESSEWHSRRLGDRSHREAGESLLAQDRVRGGDDLGERVAAPVLLRCENVRRGLKGHERSCAGCHYQEMLASTASACAAPTRREAHEVFRCERSKM